MDLNFLSGQNITFRGEIHAQLIDDNTGLIVDERKQSNMWLDQGTRNVFNNSINGDLPVYMILSSSTVSPVYTQTSIPNVIVAAGTSKLYEATPKRHKLTSSYSPPTEDRTINTIGLAYNTNGTSAYCLTNLTEPIIQKNTETLYVYYYVYVSIPDDLQGWGWNTMFSEYSTHGLAPRLFLYWAYARLRNESVFIGNMFPYITPKDPDDTASIDNTWCTAGLTGTQSYNSTKMRRSFISSNLGSNADLGSWTTTRYSGLKIRNGGGFVPFKGIHIGRIWAKNKASTATWFDNQEAMFPQGYWKAFEFRVKDGTTTLPFDHSVLTINVEGNEVDGALGYTVKSHAQGVSYLTDHGVNRYYLSPRGVETYSNKFGGTDKYVFIGGAQDNDTDGWISTLLVFNPRTGRVQRFGKGVQYYYPIWDDCIVNTIWALSCINRTVLCKIPITETFEERGWTDTTYLDHTEFVPPRTVGHAICLNFGTELSPVPKIVLWYTDGFVGFFDVNTETFDAFEIDTTADLGYVPTYARTFGYYDSTLNAICFSTSRGLKYFSLNGEAISTMSELDNQSFLTVKAWGEKRIPNSVAKLPEVASGKLSFYTTPRKGYNLKYGNIFESGPFEVEANIEEFKAFEKGQRVGLFVADHTDTYEDVEGKYLCLTNANVDYLAPTENFESATITTETVSETETEQVFYMDGGSIRVKLDGSVNGGSWSISNDYSVSPSFSLKCTTQNTTINSDSWFEFDLPEGRVDPVVIKFKYRMYFNTSTESFRGRIWAYVDGIQKFYSGYAGNSDANWYTGYLTVLPEETTVKIITRSGGAINSAYKVNIDDISIQDVTESWSTELESFGVSAYDVTGGVRSTPTYQELNKLTPTGKLKIQRDASDVIKTLYSTDGVVWNEISSTYTLSGKVLVGLFGEGDDETTTVTKATVSSYNINSGTFDKTVFHVSPDTESFIKDTGSFVYNSLTTSKNGTVCKIGTKIFALRKQSMDVYDANTYEFLYKEIITTDTSANTGHFAIDEDTGYAVASLYRHGLSGNYSRYQANIGSVYQATTMNVTYDPLTEQWKNSSRVYPVTAESVSHRSHQTSVIVPHPEKKCTLMFQLNIDNHLTQIRTGQTNHFHWSNDLNTVVTYDPFIETPTPIPFTTSWGDIHPFLEGIQIRNVLNPEAPETTFSITDKYTCIINQDGFSKDNQQYLGPFSHFNYMCKTENYSETFAGATPTYTTLAITENPGTFLSLDFDHEQLYDAYFYNADDSYAYFTDLITNIAVTSVTSQTVFSISHLDLKKVYNVYKGKYISDGSERREILEFDPVDMSITIGSAFSTTLTTSTVLSIQEPAKATKTTTVGGEAANVFYVNESAGTIVVHADDQTKKLKVDYIALFRSW